MTNREHKKLLRAIRHQQQLRDNQMLAKKIDRAFTRISEGCSNRVVAATSLVSLREKKAQEELPERSNRIYYSKPRGDMGVTCAGRQKVKGKSIPLI
ncbi:transcriptional regulator [Pseudocitrobacter sp. RIT415]|uniref:transcriptional regulator n=1 Tax=Pseudocitrobacter sp. RIT415 TaxID=2202163 RepID=UPI000D35E391|nr:transcriptional regulator [Pseudocitrobacter sp. RIT 415]RAU43956.1 transcriptional regulator [Pseudocitrobacter sp. RIT 415]